MGTEKLNLYGKQWVIIKDEHHIVQDIAVLLSPEEHAQITARLFDPCCAFKNTSSVGLFFNALAKAREEAYLQLYEASSPPSANIKNTKKAQRMVNFLNEYDTHFNEPFRNLNAYINNRFTDPYDTLTALDECLNKHLDTLQMVKQNIGHAEWLSDNELSPAQIARIRTQYSTMLDRMRDSTQQFQQQIRTINKADVSIAKVEWLLSAQNRDTTGNTQSLGQFLGEQTRLTAAGAEYVTGKLYDRYFMDMYQKNPITEAFIHAQTELRLKNSAHYGAEFTDTFEEQVDLLPIKHASNKARLLSIMPYLEDKTSASLDKILCVIGEQNLQLRTLSMPKTGRARFTYPISRLGLFGFVYVSAAAEAILFPLRLITTVGLILTRPLSPAAIDAWSVQMADYSLSKFAQRIWNVQYQRLTASGVAVDDAHQTLLREYGISQSQQSFFADLLKNTPASFYKRLNSLFNARFSKISTPPGAYSSIFAMHSKNTTEEERLMAYHTQYRLTKALITHIKTELPASASANEYFPERQYNRAHDIENPLRVAGDLSFGLSESLLNHLLDTSPGPVTAIFLFSLAGFGSNLAVLSGISALHGLATYSNILPTVIGKAFTGYSGSLAGMHGIESYVLQTKLLSLASKALHDAFDPNNNLLDQTAQQSEETLTSIVACVAIGFAIGHFPLIPQPTASVAGLNVNLYGEFLNTLISESALANQGINPLTLPVYAVIGYKSLKIIYDMLKPDILEQFNPDEYHALMKACVKNNILDIADVSRRERAILNLFHTLSLNNRIWTPVMQQQFVRCVNESISSQKTIQGLLEQEQTPALLNTLHHIKDHPDIPHNSQEKLYQAIEMLSDKESPLIFSANDRDKAITLYNDLNHLFDTYNRDVSAGLYPNARVIPKEDFLHAFRNRYCRIGSSNAIRMLSFYPGYPLRFLWRELRLGKESEIFSAILPFSPSPYVRDKIAASRAKDVVLRHMWLGAIHLTGYSFGNYIHRSFKLLLALPGGALSVLLISGAKIWNSANNVINHRTDTFKQSIAPSYKDGFETVGDIIDNISFQTGKAIAVIGDGSSHILKGLAMIVLFPGIGIGKLLMNGLIGLHNAISTVSGRPTKSYIALQSTFSDTKHITEIFDNLRSKVVAAAHVASNYHDVTSAGQNVLSRLSLDMCHEKNTSLNSDSKSTTSIISDHEHALASDIDEQHTARLEKDNTNIAHDTQQAHHPNNMLPDAAAHTVRQSTPQQQTTASDAFSVKYWSNKIENDINMLLSVDNQSQTFIALIAHLLKHHATFTTLIQKNPKLAQHVHANTQAVHMLLQHIEARSQEQMPGESNIHSEKPVVPRSGHVAEKILQIELKQQIRRDRKHYDTDGDSNDRHHSTKS